MMTVTALLHNEFRQMLWQLTNTAETSMERELASLALALYDADPEHPAVVNIVNQFTRRALS